MAGGPSVNVTPGARFAIRLGQDIIRTEAWIIILFNGILKPRRREFVPPENASKQKDKGPTGLAEGQRVTCEFVRYAFVRTGRGNHCGPMSRDRV